jgi:hypothetical protein
MAYEGRERRRHHIYVTRNTEYHLRDNICVAVRDRRSRTFRPGHAALNLRVEGGVKIFPNGSMVPNMESPSVGDAIFFNQTDRDGIERQIVTSRIERIDRPSKRDVMLYPADRR